jgi:hypothetical protein
MIINKDAVDRFFLSDLSDLGRRFGAESETCFDSSGGRDAEKVPILGVMITAPQFGHGVFLPAWSSDKFTEALHALHLTLTAMTGTHTPSSRVGGDKREGSIEPGALSDCVGEYTGTEIRASRKKPISKRIWSPD